MTTHLRDNEFVDFADGTLAASRAAHLESCADCRTTAEATAAALRQVSAVEMPEPSPLFWDHFSARVREQVAHETVDRGSWWASAGVRALVPLIAVLGVVIAIFSATMLPRVVTPARPPATDELASSHAASDAGTLPLDVDLPAAVDAQNAGVWAVLTTAASDMDADAARAAGMGAHVGAVDHEVTHLNQAELKELNRLLESELKRSSD